MARKVQHKDIIQEGLFDPTIENGKKLLILLDSVETELAAILKVSQELAKVTPLDSFKNIEKAQNALQNINKTTKQLEEVQTKRTSTQKTLNAETEKERQRVVASNRELRAKLKTEIELEKADANSIKSLQARNKLLVEQRKRLDPTTKLFRTLTTEIRKNEEVLRKLDAQIGRNQRNVGNYASALRGLRGTFTNVASAAGITFGAFGAFRVIRDAVGRIREFDKEISVIAGVSGILRERLGSVKNAIIDVAAQSTKTSNEVAKLASVLFALGRTESEVKLLLKPINDLGIALDASSDDAAELLGTTLNAFGKGAESGLKFADTISKIRVSTALNFERIKDALGFVAPAANALNLSLGDTGAILGVLQDNGIKAARAGRLTSTAFIRLADDGKTLDDALDEINAAQEKGASTLDILRIAGDLFGKRAAPLGLILANNREKTAELANEFNNLSTGALKFLTDEQLKSFDAQILILDSNFEKLLLELNEGVGIADKLSRGISFLSRNLKQILIVLGTAVGTFLAFKTVVIATRIALVGYRAVIKGAAVVQALFTKGTKAATISMKGFNTAIKSNPLGLFISLLTAAGTALLLYRDDADKAAEAQKSFNDEILTANDILKLLGARFSVVGDVVLNFDDVLNTLRQTIGDLNQEQLATLAEKLAANIAQSKRAGDGFADVAKKIREQKQALALINIELDKFKKKSEDANKTTSEATGLIAEQEKKIKDLNKALKEAPTEERIKALGAQLVLEEKELKRLKELIKGRKELTGLIEKQEKVISDLNKAIDEADTPERIRELQKQLKLEQDRLKVLQGTKTELDSTIELEKDISAQRIALAEGTLNALKELEEQRLINRKDALREIINDEESTKEEILKASQELNNIELEELAKRVAAEKDDAEVRKEIALATIDAISQAQQVASDNRLDAFDKEIQGTIDRQAQLIQKANQGVLGAQESLAEEQKKQAELELARQREEERQQKIQAGFKILVALIDAGLTPAQAVPQMGVLLAAVPAIISALPSFDKGTENTSGTGPGVDGKGGFIAINHPDERIMTADQNAKTKGLNNWELANLAASYKEGQKGVDIVQKSHRFQDNREVVRGLDKVAQAIENKETYLGMDYNKLTGLVIDIVKKGKTIERTHQKPGKIF